MVIDRDQRQVFPVLPAAYQVANFPSYKLRSQLESSKGDTFSETVIEDFVLGPEDGSDLLPAMNEMVLFDELRQWTSTQWAALLKR